ncbi:hypothetical protein JCM5350_002805 [Sporobolomyces pararoseus]
MPPSIAQSLPEDVLNEVVAYISGLEDDTITVKTLHSMTLTCRSFFYSSLPSLYLDPSRAHRSISWQRGWKLLNLLSTRSTLADCVKKLSSFDKCYEAMRVESIEATGSEEEAGRWAVEFIACCSAVRELATQIRVGGEMSAVVTTVNQLEDLTHLVVCGARRTDEKIEDAQAFVSQLKPHGGKLTILRVTGFGFGFDFIDFLRLENVPEPIGEHPSFEVERLQFDDCDKEVAWLPLFLPSTPLSLRSLSFNSFLEFDVELFALEEVAKKGSSSVEELIFRGCGADRNAIIGSIEHYDKIEYSGTVVFPFRVFGNDNEPRFSALKILVLDGIHLLNLVSFVCVTLSCRQLESICLENSIWDSEEWDHPLEAFGVIFSRVKEIETLHYLHLGHLPLLEHDEAAQVMEEECQEIDVEFEWQACLDYLSEWEVQQKASWEESEQFQSAMMEAFMRPSQSPSDEIQEAGEV